MNNPICEKCGNPDDIMERSVSRVSVVVGAGLLMYTTMLCQKCTDKIVDEVRRVVRGVKL